MSRSSTARTVVEESPAVQVPLAWRDTLRARVWRPTRFAITEGFFRGLSSLAALHPAANPERNGVQVEKDIAYAGHHSTHASWQLLDVYKPVHRPGPWPVVFYVHGGGFHLLSKDTHWLMGLVFARFGYLVVNISYRLAPNHPYPAAIEDTCLAYQWLAQNIAQLGGDPNRVAVAGESAGGNLISALALATCERRSEPWARDTFDTGLVPRAALPFCALLEVSRPERFSARRPLPRWVDGMLRDVSASYLHGHPAMPGPATELADPLRVLEEAAAGARGGFARPLPAFFAPVGTRDPLLDDTRRLAKALDALGVANEAQYYRGGIHAFHAFVWDPVARRCWRDALAFLDRHMRPTL